MEVFMQKTKLGLSVGLLAAITYLLPLINSTVFFIVVAYVLIREENIWLKKTVVKATIIYLFLQIIPNILSIGYSTLNNSLLSNIFNTIMYRIPFVFGLFGLISVLFSAFKYVICIAFAILALKQGTIKIGFLDNFINHHMDVTQE